jgi:sulfoquinovosidase
MLEFKFSKEELRVFHNGFEIITHSPSRPLLSLGEARCDFKTHKRNIASYKIRIAKRRMRPLQNITAFTRTANGAEVCFDSLLTLRITAEGDLLSIGISAPKALQATNIFQININARKNEAVYGMGEQFSRLNLKGRKVPVWTQEPGFAKNHSIYKLVGDLVMGAGGTWWSNYYPQPMYVSSQNYFLGIDTYSYCEFDFCNDTHRLVCCAVPERITVGSADKAEALFPLIAAYCGCQRRLPAWIYSGVNLGIGGGLDEVEAKLKSALDGGTCVSGVWAEDWTGLKHFDYQTRLYWNWSYHNEMYPDLPGYIEKLHKQNIRFLGYNNCFLMKDTPMFEHCKDMGYLVKNKDGNPYPLIMFSFEAYMLDLTNPGCCSWITAVIKDNMIGIGLDGWMCDFAEYLPVDCVLYDGSDPRLYHNEYPVKWAAVNAKAVKDAGRENPENAVVFFNRSGHLGTAAQSPLIWTGDQVMTFWKDSGLPASICGSISLGFCGIGHVHSDIGGEFGMFWFKRTKELFMRWTEYAAFTPVMRGHEDKGNSGWTYDSDKETLAHFAKFSRIHSALGDYFKTCEDEYQNNGLPFMRHLYIHYENEKELHTKHRCYTQYQYLLGRDILVAPVYKKGAQNRKVFLPEDQWIHLWSGREYQKRGTYLVDAPVGEIPVFIRKSSPFQEHLLHAAKALQPCK